MRRQCAHKSLGSPCHEMGGKPHKKVHRRPHVVSGRETTLPCNDRLAPLQCWAQPCLLRTIPAFPPFSDRHTAWTQLFGRAPG